MKVYILVSHAGHYQGVFRSKAEANQDAINRQMTDFSIYCETI
jgi:hypothetical protein